VIDARNGPSLKEQVEAFERGLVARALEGAISYPNVRPPRLAQMVGTARGREQPLHPQVSYQSFALPDSVQVEHWLAEVSKHTAQPLGPVVPQTLP
jgi:hypothetical protein